MSNLSQFLPIGTVTTQVEVGRVVEAAASPGASYLECNGGVITQVGYPELFAVMGKRAVYDTAPRGTAPGVVTNLDSITAVFWTGTSWLMGTKKESNLAGNEVWHSTDGINWVLIASNVGITGGVTKGFAGDTTFVLEIVRAASFVSNSATSVFKSIDDGVTWAPGLQIPGPMHSVVYNGSGVLVAVGGFGKIFRSIDAGATWVAAASPISTGLNAVTWAGGSINLFVAVGEYGTIMTSADFGSTWIIQSGGLLSLLPVLFAVHYDSVRGVIVAGGEGGWLRSSTNGTTWNKTQAGVTNTITSISSDTNGVVAFISDMVNYPRDSPTGFHDTANLTISNIASGKTLITSVDGFNWSWMEDDIVTSVQTVGSPISQSNQSFNQLIFGSVNAAYFNGTSILVAGAKSHYQLTLGGAGGTGGAGYEMLSLAYDPSIEFILPNIERRDQHTRFYIRAKP